MASTLPWSHCTLMESWKEDMFEAWKRLIWEASRDTMTELGHHRKLHMGTMNLRFV